MQPRLGLTRFEFPLDDAWQRGAITSFSASERTRLARIERPLRRAQFIIGHRMLRWLLAAAGLRDTAVEVDVTGALQLTSAVPLHASIAHSERTVAVVIAGARVGVDAEELRPLRDPREAAALMGVASAVSDSRSILRAWVLSEARLKAGPDAHSGAWSASWEGCQLAVSGVVIPPVTDVFETMTGTYNAAGLRWENAIVVHNDT
jgi:hypothetical protein